MKIKLLLLFCASITLVGAQAPINNYFSVSMSEFAIVSETVNEMPTGANAMWDFGTLTQTGTNTDTFAAPTAAELTSYPNTTQVLTITDGAMNTNQVFHRVSGSTLSLTGASNPEFTLDYNTDNAEIGTYPLTFGAAANNNAIAGNISAQGQNADYTGTIVTEVDAYGSLTFTVTGQGTYTGNVTRVTSTQNFSFTLLGFFPGTGTTTNNNYYKDSDGALVFRTTSGNVSVPGVGINESFSSAEGLITNTLSVENNSLAANSIKLYPNPVETILNIQLDNSMSIESVKIIDINGRIILDSKTNATNINTSQLQSGFYTITVATDVGSVTKKFIKK